MTTRPTDDRGFPRDYTVTAYNSDGESLSLRPHHLDNYEALCAEGWDVGPFTAAEMLAYVAELGRTGVRTDDNGALLVEPVHSYTAWLYTGHTFEYPAPKKSAHSTCLHLNTKAARSACRAKKEN